MGDALSDQHELLGTIYYDLASSKSTKQISNAVLKHIWKIVPCSRASITTFDFDAGEELSLSKEAVFMLQLHLALVSVIGYSWRADMKVACRIFFGK